MGSMSADQRGSPVVTPNDVTRDLCLLLPDNGGQCLSFEDTGQTQIADDGRAGIAQEDILRLQVPVDNTRAVDETEGELLDIRCQ